MRRVLISGGPGPSTIKVTDKQTGNDITHLFVGFELIAPQGKMLRVKLEAFAELAAEAVFACDTEMALIEESENQ